VAATYHRLWLLTELLPGAIAVTIFLTGLRLLWEAPQANLLPQVWLLIILMVFGFFFFDGLLGFTPIVRRRKAHSDATMNESLPASRIASYSVWDSVQLFIHFVSWPFLLFLGVFRYDAPNLVSNWLGLLESSLQFLPEGWPAVLIAVAIWALAGAVVLCVRIRIFRRAEDRSATNGKCGSRRLAEPG
jgi:hypothetical protein